MRVCLPTLLLQSRCAYKHNFLMHSNNANVTSEAVMSGAEFSRSFPMDLRALNGNWVHSQIDEQFRTRLMTLFLRTQRRVGGNFYLVRK